MNILYQLMRLSERMQREVNNIIVSPNTVTLRILIEQLQTTIETELRKIEQEENRIEAIPLIPTPSAPDSVGG